MKIQKKGMKGFTLIEVIVTIIIAAILGTIVFTYLGSTLTKSPESVVMVRDMAEAIEAIEEVTVEYRRFLNGEITWTEFTGWLAGQGISNDNIKNTLGVNFDVIQVTIQRNEQTLSALFSGLSAS